MCKLHTVRRFTKKGLFYFLSLKQWTVREFKNDPFLFRCFLPRAVGLDTRARALAARARCIFSDMCAIGLGHVETQAGA